MTFGDFKNRVFELIFSYSLAGSPIQSSYNNQADYIGMIPGLINSAQMDIATTVKRIPALKKVTDMSHRTRGDRIHYKLPADCWMPCVNGLLCEAPGRYTRYFNYRLLQGGQYLELPVNHPPEVTLEYFRYPNRVTAATADSEELDNTPDVHECIVYYVASYLLLYDDAYRAAELKRQYNERLARLRMPVWFEPAAIHDVYNECGEYYV